MEAKKVILDLWQDAELSGVAATFYLVYGHSTGMERYHETQDAFGREDAIRIVKSCDYLTRDAPHNISEPYLYGASSIAAIIKHVADDDYPPDTRVASNARDPNINMYSEQVTEANALQDVEPCDDPYNMSNLIHNMAKGGNAD